MEESVVVEMMNIGWITSLHIFHSRKRQQLWKQWSEQKSEHGSSDKYPNFTLDMKLEVILDA